MTTKKAVFLFGAGAVLDWGGPRTICNGTGLTYIKEHGSDEIGNRVCCLTHLITEIGFKSKDGKRVTQKIFNLLTEENGNKLKSVNFETVIDFIDEIFNYYAGSNVLRESKNIQSFLELKDLTDHLFDFEISNITNSTYTLNVPGFQYDSENYIPISISPEQKYCELLLKNLYQGLIGHVSKYSYHTSGHSVIYKDVNRINNEIFVNWCKKLIETGHCLRMHTLNYDRIFKVLLQDQDINVFEGFDLDKSSTNPGESLIPNLKRISKDYTSHCFYNLHGSGYWDITNENQNQLPGYQIYLTGVPELNYRNAVVEISKNRWVLLSNIITGYQKILKTAFSPFRQMLSAFDRDCIEANKLFLIGYSYGDEHINDIIRNARKFNPDVEIIVVNPSFDDEHFMFNFLLHWGSSTGMIYQNAGKQTITSKDFKVKIYQKPFLEFLQNDK
jgi:hypothetical protein